MCNHYFPINFCIDFDIIIFWFVKVDSVEDSFDMINSREKPLAADLFTNNKKLKEEFARNVSAGSLLINDILDPLGVYC